MSVRSYIRLRPGPNNDKSLSVWAGPACARWCSSAGRFSGSATGPPSSSPRQSPPSPRHRAGSDGPMAAKHPVATAQFRRRPGCGSRCPRARRRFDTGRITPPDEGCRELAAADPDRSGPRLRLGLPPDTALPPEPRGQQEAGSSAHHLALVGRNGRPAVRVCAPRSPRPRRLGGNEGGPRRRPGRGRDRRPDTPRTDRGRRSTPISEARSARR